MRAAALCIAAGLAFVGSVAVSAQPFLEVELSPPAPTAIDPLALSLLYQPGCPPVAIRTERIGERILVSVTEAAVCPAVIYDPIEIKRPLGTLAHGDYAVELWSGLAAEFGAGGPEEILVLRETHPFAVTPVAALEGLALDPPRPTGQEEVFVLFELSSCDTLLSREPSPGPFLHRFSLQQVATFAPCPPRQERWAFPLGALPPGHHLVEIEGHTFDGPVAGSLSFEVLGDAGDVGLVAASVVPTAPRAGQLVAVELVTVCPSETKLSRLGDLFQVAVSVNEQILAPCTGDWTITVPLGALPGGSYGVVVVSPGGTAPRLLRSLAFRVEPRSVRQVPVNGGRHRISATWRTPDGARGAASGQPLTADAAVLWFFAPTNPELLVKVLDGCRINGHYWVFAGGLTDVEVELQVVDTATDEERHYRSTGGQPYLSVRDTSAFPCP